MAAQQAPRIKTLDDREALKGLVKVHLKDNPSKSQLSWMHKDLEDVTESYQDFLTSVAQTGHRLGKKLLQKVLKEHFEGDVKVLEAFGTCMVDAISHCRKKKQGISSGKKTNKAVLRVQEAYGLPPSTGTSASKTGCLPQESHTLLESDSSVEVCTVAHEDTDGDSARAALEQARKDFAGPAGQKTLARHPSTISLKSSEPSSPHAAGENEEEPEVDLGSPTHPEGPHQHTWGQQPPC
jgi:hypothetical protein